MRWFKKISHRFWLWVDRKIVTHRVTETFDQTMQNIADDIGQTLYGNTKDFVDVADILDDSTVGVTLEDESYKLGAGPYSGGSPYHGRSDQEDAKLIRKGYDKS